MMPRDCWLSEKRYLATSVGSGAKASSLFGQIWQDTEMVGNRSPTWDILFAEAGQAKDLSFLLQQRGQIMRQVFRYDLNGDGVWGRFSDLIGAITKEKIGGYGWGWGHGTSYYNKGPLHFQGAEAFANMTTLE